MSFPSPRERVREVDTHEIISGFKVHGGLILGRRPIVPGLAGFHRRHPRSSTSARSAALNLPVLPLFLKLIVALQARRQCARILYFSHAKRVAPLDPRKIPALRPPIFKKSVFTRSWYEAIRPYHTGQSLRSLLHGSTHHAPPVINAENPPLILIGSNPLSRTANRLTTNSVHRDIARRNCARRSLCTNRCFSARRPCHIHMGSMDTTLTASLPVIPVHSFP
ncbi:hypothetical protein C8F04DRAFT_427804 [Mycena alexandri]|uniref:Uncharacterized protein n=1 Tax=Mycena alexandri TaxID=1745969 RepID=A0AAD6T384_9AGAR|nr:hypothetical protein C8F04DRAFT_427804 [Mycena alexandri]